ncbi:MAG: hypothetical protein ACI8UO_003228 [Verrucomicrobiales bacterium]|jgi:hypothetical protein
MAFSLKDYWPSEEHCDECLITEAETADVAVFLAVHQPMRLTRRPLHSNDADKEIEKREADLLKALMTENLPSGTLLLPIVGNAGVGKSHMIRWLDAHLRNRDDGVPRHIVRIPKSASLRRVLELILEGLPDKHYKALRHELTSARMPPDLLTATFNLLAKLLIALERAYKEACARISTGKERADDRERMAHCDRRGLPALLQDVEVSAHFKNYEGDQKGVLARIAERCMQGSLAVDGPANQFTESDLIFDDSLEQNKLSAAARLHLANLNRNQGRARKTAVDILNDAVDPAIGELLDFGGNSLTDLFVKIREQLLKDGKELVLLVEDFAALAGIQGSLLDAMIREGIRDGRQQLCVMRTALAVTEGYLANRETVLTRAQYEWRIDERPFASDEEAIDTFSNFVGGYLNAARWGRTHLEKAFEKRDKDAADLQEWLPDFDEQRHGDLAPEDASRLKAFGCSERGKHPLFPFNSEAIHQLARRHLREGSAFVLNPRKLLNFILRETLIGNRTLFDSGAFPPAGFHHFNRSQLALSVSLEISKRADSSRIDRLASLIFHWADDPQSAAEAACLSDLVYEAFDLASIKWSAKPERQPRSTKTETNKAADSKREEQKRRDPWEQKLQDWRGKKIITQANATHIRKWLATAIGEWIDWESLLIKPYLIDPARIALPWATTGNPTPASTMAAAITEKELEDETRADQFYTAIKAVIRIHGGATGGHNWNYPGGEEESAAYSNLIDKMAGQTADWLRREAHSLPAEGIRTLAQALLVGGRLLGMEGATSNGDAENLGVLFAPATFDENESFDSGDQWNRLQVGARGFRREAIELLKCLVSARRGASGTEQAIDASQLLSAVRDIRGSWVMPEKVDLDHFRDHMPLQKHIRDLRNLLKNAAKQRGGELKAWRAEIDSWLGSDFDVHGVVEELKQTALIAHQAAVFRPSNFTYENLRDSLNKLPECRLKETLELAGKADQGKDFGVVLSALAQADTRCEQISRRILKQYEDFLRATSEAVDDKLATAPPGVTEEGNRRAEEVASIEKLWQEVETP